MFKECLTITSYSNDMNHIIKRNGNIFYAGDDFKSRYGEIIFEEDDKHRIIIKHTFID
ncbi:MAG: hypothetical protein M0Q19_09345 [Candidatus Cloacimonetes bacterium]|nr:hypothetical protein [Candidatus Cloacimonadota bacterium]